MLIWINIQHMSRQVIESQGNNICKSASLAIHCIGKIANHSLAKTSPRVRNKWNWLLIWSSAVQASVQATCEQIASHADVLRGSSRVPALSLRTSAWEASEQTHLCEFGKKKIGCVAISMREVLAHSSRAPQLNFPWNCTSEPDDANWETAAVF